MWNAGESEQIWNAGESDARGGRRSGEQHAGKAQRVGAVFVVQPIHGGGQPCPFSLFFKAGEEAERVQVVGNQVAQGNADEKRFLMGPAIRTLAP